MDTAYAQAIEKVVARGMDPSVVATRLRDVLAARGHMKLLPKIMHALRTSSEARARKAGVTVHIARAGDEAKALAAAGTFLAVSQPTIVIDERLIGGWTLTTPEARIDASFKKQLLDLYRKITH